MEGITRRIDDLGRIVVPKEIRNALRLNEGSMLEFSVEGDGLMLKKYCPLSVAEEIANALTLSLSQYLDATTIILCQDNIFALAGKKKTAELDLSSIDTNARGQREEKVRVNDEEVNLLITPIISGGDIMGNIIVITPNVTNIAKTTCMFSSNVLSCYFM